MKLLAWCLRSRESHLYSCINDLQGFNTDSACCLNQPVFDLTHSADTTL